jgi:uncharacterized protein YoxC
MSYSVKSLGRSRRRQIVIIMKDKKEITINGLKKEIDFLTQENKTLITKNDGLQDEVDSLWAMMDEMQKSDIKNWSHLMHEFKADVIARSLMITNKVADA